MSRRKNEKSIGGLRRGIGALLCITLFIAIGSPSRIVEAAKNPTVSGDEIVDVRLLLTTDLHGNISAATTESGVDHKTSGLARAYDLILSAREEAGESNTLTFDAGDVLYDVSTRYVHSQNLKSVQPIYKAMSLVGYDAITLGNHDFDFGWEYIKNQLKLSGLEESVVVSNLTDAKSGTYPYNKNKIISREMVTNKGNKVIVKIGVVGLTVPTLSTKTENLAATLKTQDMVATAKKEAAELKAQGADIIIALAHSGFGDELPEEKASNAVYALSKLDDVDVILCGHEHKVYPGGDSNLYYYSMPGVDNKTGLVNGKTVVMASAYGKSVGVADLSLKVDSSLSIVGQKAEVRMLSDYKTTVQSEIAGCFSAWEDSFEEYRSNSLLEIKPDSVIENYFGLMQDNSSIQLVNNAKRMFAHKVVNSTESKYAGYPVIAASNYASYGGASSDDFVNIQSAIYQSDLVALQTYRQFTRLYTITGTQLKEWMEYSASAFVTAGEAGDWKSEDMNELVEKTGRNPLVKKEWNDNWTRFYCFDGVEYTIDISRDARYDFKGKKISGSKRITSLTYQGKPVENDTVFVLASNTITKLGELFGWAEKQKIGYMTRSQTLLANYLNVMSMMGETYIQADHNWKLDFPKEYSFLLSASNLAGNTARGSEWYLGTELVKNGYEYYSVAADAVNSNIQKEPVIFVAADTVDDVRSKMNVYIEATAPAGIKTLKYYSGDVDLNFPGWSQERDIQNGKLAIYYNGIYTIYAEDNNGKKSIKKIKITNIGGDGMMKPVISTYTNRKASISGKAEAGSTVYIETADKTYETKTSPEGKYNCKLPYQNAGSVITVYAYDPIKNRTSEKVKYTVKRTGPNEPVVNEFSNTDTHLTGKTNDEYVSVLALVGKNVYVSKDGGKALFEATDSFTTSLYTIFEVDVTISEDGSFSMALPAQKAGATISLYNMDVASRKSREDKVKVTKKGADIPKFNTIYNVDKVITGMAPASDEYSNVKIYVKINGVETALTPDSEGKFSLETGQLQVGQIIEAYATEPKDGITQSSLVMKEQVKDIAGADWFGEIEINPFNPEIKVLSGTYKNDKTLNVSIPGENGNVLRQIETKSDGSFYYNIEDPVVYGGTIYIYLRNKVGELEEMGFVEVGYPAPEQPYFYQTVNNITEFIQVATDKYSEIVLKVGIQEYSSSQGVLNEQKNVYIHTFPIEKQRSGMSLEVYAKNPSGTSDVLYAKVVKAVPEDISINNVAAGASKLTGKTEMFAGEGGSKSEIKVFAVIKGKSYRADVKSNGDYTITFTKAQSKNLKAGTEITVWTENKYGMGYSTSITVR